MSYSLGVVMDPITEIHFKKDTTLALLQAAQREGFDLYYFEQSDLYLDRGRAMGRGRPLRVFNDPARWFETGDVADMPLGTIDVLLMRVDPPFDNEYIYSTYILEAAEREGALVVNKPQALRDCNEKIFATTFPQCCPPLIVSRDMQRLREFHKSHKDVIFKPLDGMGGSGIFHCKPDGANLGTILEMLTDNGRRQIMGQRYIPEITNGDKRILVVDGQAVPYCLARIPEAGETRGNLAAGGRGEARPLSDRDRWIVEQVAPTLKEKGLLFVGLDVIGEYLTEINVTSPTCVREIDAAYGTDIGGLLMRAITDRLKKKE
ncbi:glutathione synthase [Microbulbifer thermotolerans]|uniref:Glutathione synthetase n=1 Tax=Microbulbifer thermotolerans TaxID=252514 RepID=A0A143HIL2_MICTH|nr:glutathione synthase [Microbulbifer thermotolerans]AMX01347.1 glutathione synthase [Microbulbifer thermotolerans]MCX2780288.1 glutathione synthase [Microbulbifer thermotolerans]MCX2782751.1 glutathione synthase [Microbulbifer thermotolerans]MCX2795506.1 glutathione synthase [Microbulbifer thermotolerans]MCX2800219.1 glutathione synthase [Microbulbifer thermotolerans]